MHSTHEDAARIELNNEIRSDYTAETCKDALMQSANSNKDESCGGSQF